MVFFYSMVILSHLENVRFTYFSHSLIIGVFLSIGETEFKFICREEEAARVARQAIYNIPNSSQVNREKFDQRMDRRVQFHPKRQQYDQNADLDDDLYYNNSGYD